MVSLIIYALAPKLGQRAATVVAWGGMLLLAIAALYGAYCWAWDKGRDHERAKWEAAAEILEDADAIADAEALDVAHDTKEGIDDGNKRAEDAARGSDDPLRDALGSLRKEGAGGSSKAPR